MKNNKEKIIIGLTGGIASGKSEVSKILADAGGLILDADKINHENLLKDGLAYEETLKAFGGEILDKKLDIDRAKLGAIVFGDSEKLLTLQKIAHRAVAKRTAQLINDAGDKPKFIVIDAPLLVEADMHKMCREVWLVVCKTEQRIARLAARNGYSREEALKRINSRVPDDELRKHANVVINNDGSLSLLRNLIQKLVNERIILRSCYEI